jgi:hypothetical protein
MTIIELSEYSTNLMNPFLKILVFFLYVIVVVLYYNTRQKCGGRIRKVIDLMFLFSLCMATGSLLRYFGDGLIFGFTEEYSLKWFQSLAYIAGAICYVLASYQLLNLFRGKNG